MAKKKHGESKRFEALRERAENSLTLSRTDVSAMSGDAVQRLVNELQVHQVELELQNEELRETQTALAESHDRYADLFDFAPVGYVRLNADGTILEANLAAAELLGVDRKEMQHANINRFLLPECQDDAWRHRQHVLGCDQRQACELSMRTSQNVPLVVRFESIAAGPEQDRHCRSALIDVTHVHRAQQLQESERRYRRLTDAVTDYIYRVRIENGRAVETTYGANCEAVTGYTAEEFLASPLLWIAIVPMEDRSIVEEQVACVLTGKETLPIEHRILRKDGRICWVLNTVSPQHDAHGQLIAYDGLLRDVTTRKQVEAELERLNNTLEQRVVEQTREVKLLAEALANLGEGVLITSNHLEWPGTKIVYVNEAMSGITGYAVEELIGQTPRLLQGEKTDGRQIKRLRQQLSQERSYLGEMVNYRKDGTTYDAELFITPLLDADGRHTNFIAVHRDITERKQAEEQLHREHDLNESIINTAQFAILLLDMQGRIIKFNPFMEQLTGWSSEDVMGRDWFSRFLRPQDQESVRRLFRRALWEKSTRGNVNVVVTRDGRELDIEWFDAPLTDSEGNQTGLVCTGRDITEQNQARLTLRRSEERLRTILRTAADAIITIDRSGIIESTNIATQKIFGYTSDELVGQNVKILMPSPYRDEHDDYIDRYLRTGEARIIGIGREVVGLRKDGSTFPASLAISEVSDLGLFTGIIRDTSERKQLQQHVIQASADEQRRIGQDLHDGVGQELTGLGLMADTLAEMTREGSGENVPGTADIANRLADGLRNALAQVRLLARGLVPVQIDPEGLSSSLNELAAHVSELYNMNCEVTNLRPVAVHNSETATHLYRIAQEATTNAVRHGQASSVAIALSRIDDEIVLRIEDNGTGLEDDVAQNIAMSSRDSKGMGMGMRIMNYRAWLIGGHLSVQNGGQGGTLVVCRVSVAEL